MVAGIGLAILALATLLGFGIFAWASLCEGERRAACVAFGLAVLASFFFFLAILLPALVQWGILAFIAVIGAVGLVLFLLPIGQIERGNDVPQTRVDERDIMFARMRLEPGTKDYEAYYAMRPENRAGDDKTRSLSGLLSPEASEAQPLVFASTRAMFALIDGLRDSVNGSVDDRQEIEGALRWRINPDTCFRYWTVLGTDCARCVALCPYSFPDSPVHNLVRWTVRHSGGARRAVMWLDGIVYGRIPHSKPVPAWIPPKSPRNGGVRSRP